MKRVKSIWYQHQNPEKWTDEYPEHSMFEQLRTTSQRYSELTAIEFHCRKYSYKHLIQSIEEVSAALVTIGIKKGRDYFVFYFKTIAKFKVYIFL